METAYYFQGWEQFCCLSPAEYGKLNATEELWTLVHNTCGVFCTQYRTAWPTYQPGIFYLLSMGNAALNTTITIDYLKERCCLGLGFGLTLGVCWEFFLALPKAMEEAFSIWQIQFHIYKIQTLIICSALSFEVGRIIQAQYALVHKRITVYLRSAQHDCTPAEGCLSVEKRSRVTSIGHFTPPAAQGWQNACQRLSSLPEHPSEQVRLQQKTKATKNTADVKCLHFSRFCKLLLLQWPG